MSRAEFELDLNLFEEYIPLHMKNRPGTSIRPASITIHNTSNTSSGADADAHSRFVRTKGFYMHNGRKNWVSWHYTIDDTKAIKQLPINEVSYHAGKTANHSSIAIETCMHKGINQAVADRRLAKLVAALVHDLGFSITDVYTHKKWTGKNCPVLLLGDWEAFIEQVDDYLAELRRGEHVPERMLISDSEVEFNELSPESKVDDFEIDHGFLSNEVGN